MRWSAGTRRGTATASTIPIGTLMANTGRQPAPNRSAFTTTPPSTRPATAPAESAAAYADSARARTGPVKVSWMMLKTCGTSTAAPAPWTSRKAIRTWLPGASAQASDAVVKTAAPAR